MTGSTLPNGLYKLSFETRSGTDYGVAYLQDGKLRGGDGGTAYLGTYKQDGELFSADVFVTQHRHVPGAVSVLGLNDLRVQLNGIVDDESCVVRVEGTSPEFNSVRFAARLSLIAD